MSRARVFVLAGGLVLGAAMSAACSTALSAVAEKIQEVDASKVGACTFVGKVVGNNGWEGLSPAPGVEAARTQALNEAGSLGATHVVWDRETKSVAQSVSGRAFVCNP